MFFFVQSERSVCVQYDEIFFLRQAPAKMKAAVLGREENSSHSRVCNAKEIERKIIIKYLYIAPNILPSTRFIYIFRRQRIGFPPEKSSQLRAFFETLG